MSNMISGNPPYCLQSLYSSLRGTLKTAGITEADLETRRIIEQRTGCLWADIIARPDKQIDPEHLEIIQDDIARRLNGEPLSRIFGKREFWGLDFRLSSETLDPRPDSETLIEAVLKQFAGNEPENILDLGTGSGCLLIALLRAFKNARGVGVDKSPGALKFARLNARRHGVAGRSLFYAGDWCKGLNACFDLVISNPPYIETGTIPALSEEVKNHDPILALDGGPDGLQAYKSIMKDLKTVFLPGGRGFFEVGKNQAEHVTRLAAKSGFHVEHVHPDLGGVRRVVQICGGDK